MAMGWSFRLPFPVADAPGDHYRARLPLLVRPGVPTAVASSNSICSLRTASVTSRCSVTVSVPRKQKWVVLHRLRPAGASDHRLGNPAIDDPVYGEPPLCDAKTGR